MTNTYIMCRIVHMSSDELLSTGQIADRLRVDRTTVHYWVRTGKLTPTHTVNGIRLFDAASVDAFGEARALLKGGANQ